MEDHGILQNSVLRDRAPIPHIRLQGVFVSSGTVYKPLVSQNHEYQAEKAPAVRTTLQYIAEPSNREPAQALTIPPGGCLGQLH